DTASKERPSAQKASVDNHSCTVERSRRERSVSTTKPSCNATRRPGSDALTVTLAVMMASFRQKISRTKFIFTNVSHQSLYCDRTLRVIHCHWLQQWSRDVRAGLRCCSFGYAQPHDLKAPDAAILPAALVPEPPEIDAPSVEP